MPEPRPEGGAARPAGRAPTGGAPRRPPGGGPPADGGGDGPVPADPAAEPERDLVAACVRGDEAAWRRFDARFRPVVTRAAERTLAHLGVDDAAGRADDVAADVFAHLLADGRAALARFEGRSSVATWLRVLARRRAARVVRRRAPDALAEPDALVARDPAPDDAAHARDLGARVGEHLEALAPRDRLALQLFYEGARSYKEVATALDLPAHRIGTLLARARARLARALGLDDAD